MSRVISLLIVLLFLSGIPLAAGRKKKGTEPDKYLPIISKAQKKKGNRTIARALNNRARYSYTLKRYSEAMQIWHEAVLVDPLWWEPYFNMGCARVVEGRMKDASEYFGFALKIDRSVKVYRRIMTDDKLKSFRNTAAYAELLHMLKHRFYLEPKKITSMEDIHYPVGWSKKGNFAYICWRYNRSCNCNGYELIIRWWKTGEVVSSLFWKSEGGNSFPDLWEKKYQLISDQLNRFKIVQFTSFQPVSGSVVIDHRKYRIGVNYAREMAFVRYRCERVKGKVISLKSTRVHLSSMDDVKVISSGRIKGYINEVDGLTDLRIRKVLISPFGNYAALLLDYESYDDSCKGKSRSNSHNPYMSLNIIRLH
jgi:hypothetical protein